MSIRWMLLLSLAFGLALPCLAETPSAAQDAAAANTEQDAVAAEIEDEDTSSGEAVFHIRVLRNPYDLARFYRLGETTAHEKENVSDTESVVIDPYALARYYRNSSRHDDSWFVIAPSGSRLMNRARRLRSRQDAYTVPDELDDDAIGLPADN
ncbi:MAG: hypothetical protein JXO72_07900 [Vicinamibacteria bacterium]|nr:hypothetical protein [Vicinamibacteria bacterium]